MAWSVFDQRLHGVINWRAIMDADLTRYRGCCGKPSPVSGKAVFAGHQGADHSSMNGGRSRNETSSAVRNVTAQTSQACRTVEHLRVPTVRRAMSSENQGTFRDLAAMLCSRPIERFACIRILANSLRAGSSSISFRPECGRPCGAINLERALGIDGSIGRLAR